MLILGTYLEGRRNLVSDLSMTFTRATAELVDITAASKAEMFLDFFQTLEREGIPYAILSDDRKYPLDIESDVDFVVSDHDLKRVHDFLARYEFGVMRVIQSIAHEITGTYFVLARCAGIGIAYLHPDVCADYRRSGRLVLRSSFLLKGKVRRDGLWWSASSAHQFHYYLRKRIDKGVVGIEHLQRLKYLAEDRWAELNFEPFMPVRDSGQMIAAIRELNTTWFNLNAKKLQKQFRAAPFQCQTISERVRNFATNVALKLARITHPTGFVVAVLGADGSGKTTVLKHIEREFAPAFRATKRFHFRPRFGSPPRSNAPTVAPHSLPPRSGLFTAGKLLFFLTDYWVSWGLKIHPLKVKSNLLLFDRYLADVAIDPVRYRVANLLLARLTAAFAPRPDAWIILVANPAVMIGRKAELSEDAAKKLNEAYSKFSPVGSTPYIHVNTDAPLEETLQSINTFLIDVMAARFKSRHLSKSS